MKTKNSINIGSQALHENYGLVWIRDISKKFSIAKIEQAPNVIGVSNPNKTHLVPLETLSPIKQG
jgi:hypothetical protein